jgi:sialate O-acetylesterase
LSLLFVSWTTNFTWADVRLPQIISDHMVVQRDMPINIWGWADPGEQVTVAFVDTTMETEADEHGHWKVSFERQSADAISHRMNIQGNNEITIDDVLIGEVWLGSGQSNMEMPMDETGDTKAITAADHPQIRLFHITHAKANEPSQDVDAAWKPCSPASVHTFSAPLYFFGRRIENELGVPIGLINSSWGGSPIEQWTPADPDGAEMYNAMIAPLQEFPIRGILWYQGEANVYHSKGMKYLHQMETLIRGWRGAWGQGLPFYYVQIAPWDYSGYPPGQVPELRDAQRKCLHVPLTGMVVTTDLVDPAGLLDGHPRNKRDVGARLARWALAKTYGRDDLVFSGPLYESCEVTEDRVRLRFRHAEGLKSSDGKPLREFEVAGEHGHFVPATAEIDGDTIVVYADMVPLPTQVRFGWRTLTNPNLVNEADLPASPFNTKNSGTYQN